MNISQLVVGRFAVESVYVQQNAHTVDDEHSYQFSHWSDND